MGSNVPVLVVIALSALLAAYVLIARRQLSHERTGRVIVLFAVLLLPLGAAALGASHNLQRSTEKSFCLSCHEMQQYGQSLLIDDNEPLPAVHFQKRLVPRDTACYTCHADYAMFGTLKTKLTGLRHVWNHYVGGPPAKIKLYKPYPNANCLHCHDGARGFESSPHHDGAEARLVDIKSNKVSCMNKGCHAVAHSIADLGDADFWKHPSVER